MVSEFNPEGVPIVQAWVVGMDALPVRLVEYARLAGQVVVEAVPHGPKLVLSPEDFNLLYEWV